MTFIYGVSVYVCVCQFWLVVILIAIVIEQVKTQEDIDFQFSTKKNLMTLTISQN